MTALSALPGHRKTPSRAELAQPAKVFCKIRRIRFKYFFRIDAASCGDRRRARSRVMESTFRGEKTANVALTPTAAAIWSGPFQ
jgi:hypothetical protein